MTYINRRNQLERDVGRVDRIQECNFEVMPSPVIQAGSSGPPHGGSILSANTSPYNMKYG